MAQIKSLKCIAKAIRIKVAVESILCPCRVQLEKKNSVRISIGSNTHSFDFNIVKL